MNFLKSIFSNKQNRADNVVIAAVPVSNVSVLKLEKKQKEPLKLEKGIYFDYASVTPVDDQVLDEIVAVTKEFQANPSSLYGPGVKASKKLSEARERVAQSLEVHTDEIFFTSGGTESNNMAIKGLILALASQVDFTPHIISSTIEHPSILEVLKDLSRLGICQVTLVPVTENGIIDIKAFKEALRTETVLVTVQYVNNEIGTIQPLQEIAKAIRFFRKNSSSLHPGLPYFHTDACQAPVYCSLRIPSLGTDMMTLDGSKLYGPRGFGILFKKRGIKVRPLMYGGAQEESVRPGTENVAHAAAFALALEKCQKNREVESMRIKALRDDLLSYLKTNVPDLLINGDMDERLPNNINICKKGIDAEFAVICLDAKGVFVSSVTSCRSKKEDSSSYVVEALGKVDCAKSSLRITFGNYTTAKEVEAAKLIISSILNK